MKNVKTIAQTKKVTLNKIVISSFTKSQTKNNEIKTTPSADTMGSLNCDLSITK